MTHDAIWTAIDKLAALHGVAPSRLAIMAGLDSTVFNKSKRFHNGRERWPSTETIARVLDCTGKSFDDFAALLRTPAHGFQTVNGRAAA